MFLVNIHNKLFFNSGPSTTTYVRQLTDTLVDSVNIFVLLL